MQPVLLEIQKKIVKKAQNHINDEDQQNTLERIIEYQKEKQSLVKKDPTWKELKANIKNQM